MSVELLERDATDAEKLFIAWLNPLTAAPFGYRIAIKRKAGDQVPFVIVNELVATEDAQQMSAYPTMSVHILGETEAETSTAASVVHRRVLVLARDPLQDITLADASVANIEWLKTVKRPGWEYYSDTVLQKCARYQMAIPFIDVEE